MHQEETIRCQINQIILMKIILGNIDRRTGFTLNHKRIYATQNLAWKTHILVQHFAAGLTKDIINGAINQWNIVLHSNYDLCCKGTQNIWNKQKKKHILTNKTCFFLRINSFSPTYRDMETCLSPLILDIDFASTLVVEKHLSQHQFDIILMHILARARYLIISVIRQVESRSITMAGIGCGIDIAALLQVFHIILRA